ncbi:hypothetical protein GCM10020229_76900 [Kitasatospora albolonga]
MVEVPVYRWLPPADIAPLDRLLDACCTGALDAITFTSAPAVLSLLDRAAERGLTDQLLHALRRDVLPVCVGPVTAAPLEELDIATVWPERMRLGAMVQLLTARLPERGRRLSVAGHQLELRGQAALVDGELRPVPPAGMALLRALARRPGWVVARAELLRALPGSGQRRARRGDRDGPPARGPRHAEPGRHRGQARLPPGGRPDGGAGGEVRRRLTGRPGPKAPGARGTARVRKADRCEVGAVEPVAGAAVPPRAVPRAPGVTTTSGGAVQVMCAGVCRWAGSWA